MIENLLLNTDQFRPDGRAGYNLTTTKLLILYNRYEQNNGGLGVQIKGEINIRQNFENYMKQNQIVPHKNFMKDLLSTLESYKAKIQNNQTIKVNSNDQNITKEIIGLCKHEGEYYIAKELKPDELDIFYTLNDQFETSPDLVMKWNTQEVLSYLFHSKLSGSSLCGPKGINQSRSPERQPP